MASPTKLIRSGPMDLDEILGQLGQFGKYHVISYCLISLPLFFSAMFALTYVFTTLDVDHRCYVPECENTTSRLAPYRPPWLEHAVPMVDDKPSRCTRYAAAGNGTRGGGGNDTCPADWFAGATVECNDWVFRRPEKSIVNEWNITCESNKWKLTLVGTINNVGQFIGFPIAGFMSDRFGRRNTLVASICLSSMMGIAKSFSPNYITFLFFEFMDPVVGIGIYSSGFVLGMELVGPQKRVLGGVIISSFYSIGETLLGLIALWLRNWRHILRVVYAPGLLFISYYWLIPESVRWLISKGRADEARDILRRAAKTNGIDLDESLLYSEKVDEAKIASKVDEEASLSEVARETLVDVFKSKILLLRLLNCSFCWLTNTFVFFGLALNSVSVGGNAYSNFILVALIEIPAFVATYLIMDRWGRKMSMFASLTLAGVSCIGFMFMPEDMETGRLVLFMGGKFAITISFTVLYVYTAEMFPTQHRHSLLGTCGMFGRVGSIVAPQTPLLDAYVKSLPLLLFGAMSLTAGLLALLFPETLNAKLPDTIEDAEKIGKKTHIVNPHTF